MESSLNWEQRKITDIWGGSRFNGRAEVDIECQIVCCKGKRDEMGAYREGVKKWIRKKSLK